MTKIHATSECIIILRRETRDLLEKRCSDEGPPNSRILPARCSGFLRGALVSGAVLLLAARCACMLAPCPLTCPGRLAPGDCQANKTHGNVAHQAFPGFGAKGAFKPFLALAQSGLATHTRVVFGVYSRPHCCHVARDFHGLPADSGQAVAA